MNSTKRNNTGLRITLLIILSIVTLTACGGIFFLYHTIEKQDASLQSAETELKAESANQIPCPTIDQQFLTINEYSRPGTPVVSVDNIVIHYLGNPETTAQQNRNYFESLKDLKDVSMSANYVVGLDGEIIQCVPDTEVAYASNEKNRFSLSIENCHVDETGKLLDDTYLSLVKLTAYLTAKYHLGRDDIIRHYDVTGKECPLFYVENEEYWEQFKDDVMRYRQACMSGQTPSDSELEIMLAGLAHTYRDDSYSA